MTQVFEMFVGWFQQMFDVLEGISFEMYGHQVNYLYIVMALLVISITANVFWKGARA